MDPSNPKTPEEELGEFFSNKYIKENESFIANAMTNGANLSNNEPITLEKLLKNMVELEAKFRPKGIYITHIVPPKEGWLIAFYCPICKETTFLYDKYACKPSTGDFLMLKNCCANDEHWQEHTIKLNLPQRRENELFPIQDRGV